MRHLSWREMRRQGAGFDSVGRKVLAPLLRFGEVFEEVEAAAHESENVRHENQAANELAWPAERHREANAIIEKRTAFGFDEAVVVLEALEAAGDHAVLKEVRRLPCLRHDERDVIVDEAELQALPAHCVAGSDEAADAALNRMHAELALDDSKMRGEREAALDGCLNQEAVTEREHLGPFDSGETARSLWEWLCSCRNSSIRSTQRMTPLFRCAFGYAANNCPARLKKFYEIAAQKTVLSQGARLHQKGQRNDGSPHACRTAGEVGQATSFVPLCDTIRAAPVSADTVSVV